MKKLFFALVILACVCTQTIAQELKPKKTSVFKFHPFSLITSSLVFGRETFNEQKTRSTVLTLGIRYKNSKENNYAVNTTDPYNKWTGVSLGIEKRFYVPSFGTNTKNPDSDSGEWGIYLGPELKVDYNSNKIKTASSNFTEVNRNFLGVKPSVNIGIEFTIFKNMYLDAYLGGGIRFVNKSNLTSNYDFRNEFGDQNYILTRVILAEGVRPNGGLTFGLKL
jgi:hypothetical protein